MKKILLTLLFFVFLTGFSQAGGEKLFRGQLVNDSIKVENIIRAYTTATS